MRAEEKNVARVQKATRDQKVPPRAVFFPFELSSETRASDKTRRAVKKGTGREKTQKRRLLSLAKRGGKRKSFLLLLPFFALLSRRALE